MSVFSTVFNWENKGGKGPWGTVKGGKSTGGRGSGGNPGPGGQPPEVDEIFREAHKKLQGMMGGGNGGGAKSISLIAIGLGVLWLASGFYMVAPDEEGVVLRFGKYVQTTTSGLNYHLPAPIETVIKPPVTRENIVEVGFRSNSSNTYSSFMNSRSSNVKSTIPAESLMLTGDENIVDLSFTVRWRIIDARDFLFNVSGPVETVKNVAESAMREVIGRRPVDDALTGSKENIQDEAKVLIQSILDGYRSGIQVNGVELQEVNPPKEVIDAFRDVQAARADAEKARNEAEGYSNDILPRARGEAAQVLQDAEAYKASKIADATGRADRFLSQLKEYRKAKNVTKERMYLETMENVLEGSRKVIISGEAGQGVLPYLPINEINKGGQR